MVPAMFGHLLSGAMWRDWCGYDQHCALFTLYNGQPRGWVYTTNVSVYYTVRYIQLHIFVNAQVLPNIMHQQQHQIHYHVQFNST